ncbi:hypothetical protein CKAH01_11192 [Colletotrichum kahawae]|uniref:Uncharacterized protein n=1 Tax=Colletotrichum kahawae TaxID=34407 RepID=A0AAD9XVN7_COLKA|nr:hypothetical protein CKAH01_11192 [Colletotrichum kahawae]
MKCTVALMLLAFAAPAFALTFVEAYDRVYAYMIYDMDVTVWGPGKGYIAPKCMGSRSDQSCTFNEFINFVEFGEAASSPTYYTLDGTYYLTPSTIYTIGDALRGVIKSESGQTWWHGLFPSRKSHTGIWNDFGFVIDQSTSVAPQRDIPIGRHLENVEMVLGAVSQSRAAQLNSKTLGLLSSNVKDVIWQIVEKESAFVDNKWNEIDWDATIKKYPDMSKPNSDLFKKVTAELRTLHGNNAAEVTVRRKVMDMVHLCFGG